MSKSINPVVVPLRTLDIVRKEASEWLVRLDSNLDGGGLSASDQAELRRWLAQDTSHGQALKRQAQLWQDMDVFASSDVLGRQTQAVPGFWALFRRTPLFKGGLAMACAILLAVVTLNFYSPGEFFADDQLYATEVGGQRVETFSDGSTVYLNTDTLLKVDYSDTERKIVLLRGEAVFDVAHDPERPFVVYAEDRQVTAVGTKFVVRLTSDKVRVTVAEGKVKLARRAVKEAPSTPLTDDKPRMAAQEVVLLAEGQKAEVSARGEEAPQPESIDHQELEKDFSWVDGKLIFDDESLGTIISEVNRYTSIKVVIVDPEIKDVRLSGRFQVGDTEALLEAIEISQQEIAINRAKDGEIVYITTQETL